MENSASRAMADEANSFALRGEDGEGVRERETERVRDDETYMIMGVWVKCVL